MTTVGAPSKRADQSAVWTGDRMVVWGGAVDTVNHDYTTSSGASYDPAGDTWTDTPAAGAPASREAHSAVWTGHEMIVWGGQSAPGGVFTVLGDGGRLALPSGAWHSVGGANAPSPRTRHSAVWSGNQMLVWGGVSGDGLELGDGATYDPVTDSWRPFSMKGAPLGRHAATAVWTGAEMAIWGGLGCGGSYCGDGAFYDPATDRWRSMSTMGAPAARAGPTSVWTGDAIVVWGGGAATALATGGVLGATDNLWTATSPAPRFSGRSNHTAIWTGSAMLIWGGRAGDPGLPLGDGAAYTP